MMVRLTIFGVILLAVACVTACNRAPGFSIIPAITFISVSPTIVHDDDSIRVVFSFKDGDGDIGRANNDTIDSHSDIVFYDNRVVDPTKPKDSSLFRIPDITPFGKVKAVSGTIRVVRAVYRIPGRSTDTVSYNIKIKDRAGHWSNTITTSKVVITP